MKQVSAPVLASLFAACADARPDPVVPLRRESGITSNNGGGTRTGAPR